MSLLLRWAARFARTTPRLRPSVSLGLVAFFLFGINTYLDSQSVGPDAYVSSVVGNSQGLFRYADPVPYGKRTVADFQRWAAGADVEPILVSRDFPVYELADDGFHYVERDWAAAEDTGAEPVAGRLPTAPGEVAVVAPRRDLEMAQLGREVAALGGSAHLRVVGLLEPSLDDNPALYAAPGTWSGLGSVDRDLAAVSAEAQLLLGDLSPEERAQLTSEGHQVLTGTPDTATPTGPRLGKLVTRAEIAEKAPQGWTDRSPILFLVPGALLPGLVMLVLASSQARRLVPAARTMTQVGVGLGRAVAAPLLPVVAWAGVGVLAGAALGTVAGLAAARFAPWGIASPSTSVPWEALLAVVAGMVIGPVVAWTFIRMRVTAGSRSPRTVDRSRAGWGRLRHVVALVLLALVVHRALSLRHPDDGLVLVCLALGLAVVMTPEILLAVNGVLPSRLLRDKLVRRLIADYLPRVAAYVALVALGTGLATAVVVALQSAVAAEQARQGSTAPPGVVALDNDDAPSLPVADEVRQAAEQVAALAGQEPVQLWSSGRSTRTPDGAADVADMVTTSDGAGVLFAAESTDDLQRLVGRTLTGRERGVLEAGGVLVTDPEAVMAAGRVGLVAMTTGRPIAAVPGVRAEVRPAPWFVFVPGYVLTDTAEDLGIPVTPGALVYTGVSAEQARQVQRELAAAGINPEQAEIHRELPAVVPDAALVGWCVGFLLLLIGVSVVITRSQAESMRGWAGRLHLVGVDRGWVSSVLVRQHLVLTFVGLGVGVTVGFGGLLLTRLRLPAIEVEVPWLVIGLASLAVAVAPVVALVLSLRLFSDLTGAAVDGGE